MKHVRLTAQAQVDLDEIWLFIAKDNLNSADRFHDQILSKFLTLAEQPLIGRSREELRPSMRSLPVGSYVIFYREAPKHIEIIRILHGARDIESNF